MNTAPCQHRNAYIHGEDDDIGSEESTQRWHWDCIECGEKGEDVASFEEAVAMLQALHEQKH